MNIGLFSDSYYPLINGVTTSVDTLAKFLEKRGHTVYIFAPSYPSFSTKSEKIIRMRSMPCVFIKNFRLGLLYSPIELKEITSLKLDIIHTQTEFSLGIFAKLFSKAFAIPMVHTYHTMYEDYVHYIVNGVLVTPSMAKEFSKIFCNSANAVIAPTEKVKNVLNEYGVIKPINVVPTGINIEHFRKSNYFEDEILKLKTEIGLNPKDPVILSLGRVAKEKSIDVVIKGFSKLLPKISNAKLVIVGDGPAKKDLESLAYELGIESNIIFTGAKPWKEIGKYYQLGDVFVSASVTETQGLTFIEAMAAGIPVVAKNDPSIEGIVQHEKTGLLFNHDEELSDKLFELLNDKSKCQKIIKTSIETVEELSAETFAEKIEELYTNIIKNPEKYDFHKHALVSPIYMGKKAVKKLSSINKTINTDLIKNKELIKELAIKSKTKILGKK